ncbi:MAG: hypothetical protein MUC96_33670 [Myxococcaceae bacterium]|nr:hypothetical protein [Myxococcaceae bacterium]
MRVFLVVVVLAGLSCVRSEAPKVFDSLVGLDAALIPGPGVRLALPGAVFERPAEVTLDVTRELSVVTTGCLDTPMVSATRVKVVDPLGAETVFPITRLAGLTVAGRRLRPMEAGLAEAQACSVTLGMDMLTGAALEVDVARRLVRFVASRPRSEWLATLEARGGEAQVLELTRDPLHDWPLLAVRLTQGQSQLTGAFLLSTTERSSRVFDEPARAAGFSIGSELLQALDLPKGVELPAELAAFSGLAVDRAELAPGVGAQSMSFLLAKGSPRLGVLGLVAADLWGRFEATLDVTSGTLVLHRPRVLTSGSRSQCARGDGTPTEDACFELFQERRAKGLVVTATVWRPLAQGGRLYFDFPGLSPVCRMGVTFDAGDRGRSTQHLLPWPRLFETMKACAESVAPATQASLGLFEDAPLPECPGVCAFAQDLRTGRVNCECQPGPVGLSGASQRAVLDRLRALLKQEKSAPPVEPADPEPSKTK